MYEDINGDQALLAIERAINELRCGRAVYCHAADAAGGHGGLLLACAETASESLLSRLEQLAADQGLTLAITAQRAQVLGLGESSAPAAEHAVMLTLAAPVSRAMVWSLAGAHALSLMVGPGGTAAAPAEPMHAASLARLAAGSQTGGDMAAAALRLAKHARLLPAVLTVAAQPPPPEAGILSISMTQLARLTQQKDADLQPVSEARVPLAGTEDCRLVLFRDGHDASEHVAIIIGSPRADAIPVRLHSACLTGDLLGSLRCDCGDQLRGAVEELAIAGGGVLLYLAQEGRGIGLANKLRAYELQDTGLDTIEADRHLGFQADERSYTVAASMLRHLGMTRIHLLTNNLEKIEALEEAGIEVVTRQRLLGAVNRHNVRYIRAKRERAGHLMPEVKVEGLP